MTLAASTLDPRPGNADWDVSGTAAFMAEALDAAARAPGAELVIITVPAPVAPLEALAGMDSPAGLPTVLWDPPSGPSCVGVGVTVDIAASGPERIREVARRAEAEWSRLRCVEDPGHAGQQPFRPRFFGGFAFARGAASAPPWSSFGDARFVLPTWLYTRHRDRACLSLAVDTASLPARSAGSRDPGARYLGQLERVAAALRRGAASPGPAPAPRTRVVSTADMEPAAWRAHIDSIRAAIAAGRCDKIVAARCTAVELARAPEPAAVLGALDHKNPDCYRFGFGFGQALFVGATPERLIARRGDRVLTEALAGSIAATPDWANARALLDSRKDRAEQDLVVQTIASKLAPLCRELDVPPRPVIRALRHVLHLETPIAGRLRRDTHVLELVAALHPTPAVGGVPTATAMAWIAEREPAPRGWYAAPVGWFDRDGQGEFAVAIRSGLLAGPRAYIYAGAGIVRDSEPDAELAETRLKQRAVLDALGVAP